MKDASCTGGNVLEVVVRNKLCVGCGMCAGLLPTVLRMRTDKYGAYVPELIEEAVEHWGQLSLRVCPFAESDVNEDTIAKQLFGHREGIKHRSESGYYLQCFAGHVTDNEARLASTSGGIATWLAGKILSGGEVAAVACVGPSDNGETLFEYQLIRNSTDVSKCRKAQYYPVQVSEIMEKIRELDGGVLFVGLPCFIKALRLAARADTLLKDRIRYTIGLFCGHLKTKHYCAYLARNCCVDEKKIKTVDFRKKIPGKPASKYAFEVFLRNDGGEKRREIMMEDVWASSWSNNLFMLDACECCDDIMAETADISVGDAWLPEYKDDYRGTNLVVCRNKDVLRALKGGVDKGELSLKEISVEKVIQSQVGCIRQRREGLQYRLYLSSKKGQWRPHKRVRADRKAGSFLFRLHQLVRIKIRTVSKEAFLKQQSVRGLDMFISSLRTLIVINELLGYLRHGPKYVKRRIADLFKRKAGRT